MANSEHLAKLKEGVGAWNSWRKATLKIAPDLSEADLSRANFSGAELSFARLSRADLSGAHLNNADLYSADLSGADLAKADFGGADLSGADLSSADLSGAHLNETNLREANAAGASLSGADLTAAHLRGADLTGTDLTEASIGYTTFGDNDLSHVKGLESVQHAGPSTIGIDTIYRSQGKIPLAFLRGSAIPPKTRNSPTACTRICRTKASAAGSRRTIFKPERRSTSRLTKRYGDMKGCS
jgi:uncharacterized protein YjbI with pentapeptide repeats